MSSITIIQGDITREAVDIIVNAANSALSGGGGVDSAIHRVAGPLLKQECLTLGRCPIGECRITDAYSLPAKRVIHAVGPVWSGGTNNEETLLSSVYTTSLDLCKSECLTSIAFPNISCGAYRFPIDLACKIAHKSVSHWLASNPYADIAVRFVCYDSKTYKIFNKVICSDN